MLKLHLQEQQELIKTIADQHEVLRSSMPESSRGPVSLTMHCSGDCVIILSMDHLGMHFPRYSQTWLMFILRD